MDMDGDGLLDVLAARCTYPVWPWAKKQGELVWLKQPAQDALAGQPWQLGSPLDSFGRWLVVKEAIQ